MPSSVSGFTLRASNTDCFEQTTKMNLWNFPSSRMHLFIHATVLANSAGPLHPRHRRMVWYCFQKALNPQRPKYNISELYQLLGSTVSPTAYMILCVRFDCFVRGNSTCSATAATLDTGDWLSLTRQGLSPCKMHQALLGTQRPFLRNSQLQSEIP